MSCESPYKHNFDTETAALSTESVWLERHSSIVSATCAGATPPTNPVYAIEGTPIPHPDYSWGDADPHDVGVVILDVEVDIEPAALPTPSLLADLKKDRILEGGSDVGVYFTSRGYGGTLTSWPPPVLDYDRVRRVSQSEYVALTKVHLHLSQKAVFDEAGSCFGDSGGPVFWADPDGNEIIAAVTSTGDAQCVATGINYRVDIPDMLEWIEEQIASTE